jgi:uncharacterized Zn-finger protein
MLQTLERPMRDRSRPWRAVPSLISRTMCVGANPPFDHPHVFLDMGADDEKVCPYCSTLYRHVSGLRADETRPAGALYLHQAA